MCCTTTNQRKAGVAISVSDKTGFRAMKIIKDGERHYIMMSQSMKKQQQAVLIAYELNTRTVKYVKHKLTELKGKIQKFTVNS